MTVKNKTNKNDKRSQCGRSMVEMLGVLAIIGVLSVGGVYGYGVAMKKHEAYELLHQASMLAATISAQIMSGKDPTTLDTFADSNLGKFALDYDPTKTTFDLKISELDDSVCSQLKEGGMVQKVQCNETAQTATLTYYKNLATDSAEGEKSPTVTKSAESSADGWTGDEMGAVCNPDTKPKVEEGKTACSVCLKTGENSSEWNDSDALCDNGDMCIDGACISGPTKEPVYAGQMCKCMAEDEYEDIYYCGGNSYVYCGSDADCRNYGVWDANLGECVANFCIKNSDCSSDEYCHYNSLSDSCPSLQEKGVCVSKVNAKGTFPSDSTAEDEGFIVGRVGMNWFTAQNFCRSYGKKLVTLDQMGLGSVIPSGERSCDGNTSIHCNITSEEHTAIRNKFGGHDLWTAKTSDGIAFYVFLSWSEFALTNNSLCSDYSGVALCK